VTDRAKIAGQYLRKWFWVDLLATFPFDLLFLYLMDSSDETTSLAILAKFGRLYRMTKLLRLIKLLKLAKDHEKVTQILTETIKI
jgi:hypothetical protein